MSPLERKHEIGHLILKNRNSLHHPIDHRIVKEAGLAVAEVETLVALRQGKSKGKIMSCTAPSRTIMYRRISVKTTNVNSTKFQTQKLLGTVLITMKRICNQGNKANEDLIYKWPNNE